MIFSKKALLALILTPSPLALAQKATSYKKNNLKGAGMVPPVQSIIDEMSDQERRLAAIDFPSACVDLAADRAGWTKSLPATDDSSVSAALPFSFNFYGQSYTAVFINNNGNLSFGSSSNSYIPTGFPVSGTAMIAPYWADVDTRAAGSVWHQAIGTKKFAVTWDHVGVFNRQTAQLNTFQVVLSDGTDPSMGYGNNVCFCYEDMQWATVDPFYGIYPATAGINKGNNVDYFQIGRFTQTGYAYDGAYGSNDGVDYLDGKSFCFKAGNTVNVPPIASNLPANNRVDLACGASITNLPIVFLAPEVSQSVTITSSGASNGLTVTTSQQSSQTTATINWTPTSAATVNLVLTASDTIDTTSVTLTFTSPGPCCQGTTAEIWNPTTDALVGPLVNGSTYCLTKYNLRAVTCENIAPVFLKLWKTGVNATTVRRQTENEPPFFLWGNIINGTGYNDVQPSPNKVLANGNYALRINATNPNAYAEIHFTQSCP